MLASVVLVVATPLGGYMQSSLKYLGDNLTTWGPWAPLVYMGLKVVGTGVGFPAAPLTILAGAVFGTAAATLWTTIGAGLGATVAFFISRFLLRGTVQKRLAAGGWLTQLDQGLANQGFWYVLSTRLTPFLPFNVLNYLYGLTSVAPKTYILATFIGIIPINACYAWFGETVGTIARRGEVLPSELVPAFLALTGLAVLAVLPAFLQRQK